MPDPLPSAVDGLLAVSRLLALASPPASGDGRALLAAVAEEARKLLGVPAAALIDLRDRSRAAAPAFVASDGRTLRRSVGGGADALDQARESAARRRHAAGAADALDPTHAGAQRPGAADASGADAVEQANTARSSAALVGTAQALTLDPAHAPALGALFGDAVGPLTLLPLPPGAAASADYVLVLAGTPQAPPAVAEAYAHAAAGALSRLRAGADEAARAARQAALTRAAKSLQEALDIPTLLGRVCEEAVAVLDADTAAIFAGTPDAGLTVRAAYGVPAEALGWQLPAGSGLAGRVMEAGAAMAAGDYQAVAGLPPDSPLAAVQSVVAAPIPWLGGVLSVGYRRRTALDDEHTATLTAFAELAGVAFQNASVRAGLARAASTDPLTGCLNHAALHEGLAAEIDRAARAADAPLALILLDLDDFKAVNDLHGHLVGDEVLRRVGHALRSTTRPYDLAARYGGDEFALVAAGADEAQAAEIARRALERIAAALGDLDGVAGGSATAGVAEWEPGLGARELIARTDRAMLFGKRHGRPGQVHLFSELPPAAQPRFGRAIAGRSAVAPSDAAAEPIGWPAGATDERLRRRTRQLALANQLGARLAAMTGVDAILEAALEELHRAFGFHLCLALRLRDDDLVESASGRGRPAGRMRSRGWRQPRDAGLVGRCLRTRRPVLCNDVRTDADYRPSHETRDVRAELIVPVFAGDELWGALDLQELEVDAFDQDDLVLAQTVADQVGSALRGAVLYERLERAYLGTAEALAAALEAKDSYTAQHARSIVEQAEAVGRRLGMDEAQLHDLRLGAIFHDIGKIAIHEAILHKRGPLTREERAVIERHTVIGEQILAPVEFLAGVRPLVRHEHERWDGRGYPDGLADEAIPLGSRIILACDALHAMTSDRPYRTAMSPAAAHAELRRHAGTQFDPRVVDSLLALVAPE